MIRSTFTAVCFAALVHPALAAAPPAAPPPPTPRVPDGFTIELVAAPPLVEHPIMACFDERGRLFVAETAGKNLPRAELEKQLPNFIRMLEDTDGDGKFDKSVIFADKLTFPQGVLPLDGSVYTCSSGALWKLTDTDGDNIADKREKIVSSFGYTGNAADIHGPFLGPDGRLYICEGRHGHEVRDAAGKLISKGKAGRIFSCKTDGSDFRSFCGGGFDNPIEIVFTEEGDMLGTVNLMYGQPRGDCLVHWVYGGVYPRSEFLDQFKNEFYFTGEPLKEIHNFGHVALSGLCRYRSEHFGLGGRAEGEGPRAKGKGKDDSDTSPSRERSAESARPGEGEAPGQQLASPLHLFITQFNTHKVIHTTLGRSGSTYKVEKNEDFLTCDSIDFHPTDVLEDADGSLLVIDTGGWFRIGCPVSQVEKPQIKGGIYRVKMKDGKRYDDPRGLRVDWSVTTDVLKDRLADHRLAVIDRASAEIRRRSRVDPSIEAERETLALQLLTRQVRRYERSTVLIEWVDCVRRLKARELVPDLLRELPKSKNDRIANHAIIYALIEIGDREATAKGLASDNEKVRRGAAIALEQMRRKLTLTEDKPAVGPQVPSPSFGTPLTKGEQEKVVAIEKELNKLDASGASRDAASGGKVFASKKAGCAMCHKIGEQGAEVSLNLSKIGAIRGRRDLLESILFPNASFARGFEPFIVTTKYGTQHVGVISRETSDAIYLKNANNQETKLLLDSITDIRAGKTSIMPGNYAETLSRQELADLLAYLLSLK